MAVGLTLIFGVLDIINIAQGILVVLGAYLSYVLSVHLHIDLFVGLLITVPPMFVLGVASSGCSSGRCAAASGRRCRCWPATRSRSSSRASCTGSSAPNFVTLQRLVRRRRACTVFGFYLPDIYLYGFALAVALVVALYLLLYRTRFGRSVRATMQDQTAARLIGIDVNRVAALTFGIGVAVTAAGGMVYGATSGGFNPNSGYDLISRLLAIIILGGLGSIGGALAAAVFMITLESRGRHLVAELGRRGVLRGARHRAHRSGPTGLFGRQAARAQ